MGTGPIVSTGWKRQQHFRHRKSFFGKLILQQLETRREGRGPVEKDNLSWGVHCERWVDVTANDVILDWRIEAATAALTAERKSEVSA